MSTPSIPHTQTAILFEKTGGPLILKRDHPVTQPQDLQPGECLVNIKVSSCPGNIRPELMSPVRADPFVPSHSHSRQFSGVCHTDLHAMKYVGATLHHCGISADQVRPLCSGDWPLQTKLPLIGGHEGAGIVVAIAGKLARGACP